MKEKKNCKIEFQPLFPPAVVPMREWENLFGWPGYGTLRYLALRRRENGFDQCVTKVNKRLYLITDKTLAWLKEARDE